MSEQKLRLHDRVYCAFGFGRIAAYASRRGGDERRFSIQLEHGGFGAVCELSETECEPAGQDDTETVIAYCAKRN